MMLHGNTKYNNNLLDVLKVNYNTMNNDDLSELLHISKTQVRYLLDKMKLKRERNVPCRPYKRNITPTCDMLQPLLSDDLITFYWIGFIMADGWIRKADSGRHEYYQLGMELSIKDYEHLCKLANFLSTDCKVSSRSTNFKENYKFCYIGITNFYTIPKIMEKYNINFNKTTNPPIVENYKFTTNQLLAMFIGFIDGDGSITYRKSSKNSFQSIISIQNRIEWKAWLEYMLLLLKREFSPTSRVEVRVNTRNHVYVCLTQLSMLTKIKDFAINNKLPILTRKWDNIHS